jgi:hypothetical protein
MKKVNAILYHSVEEINNIVAYKPVAKRGLLTTTVSGQRLGKHFPGATNTQATIELLL